MGGDGGKGFDAFAGGGGLLLSGGFSGGGGLPSPGAESMKTVSVKKMRQTIKTLLRIITDI
jgi:hypothetical protein